MKIGVIGATGAVGREMLKELLNSPKLMGFELCAFASPRSAGQVIDIKGRRVLVHSFDLEKAKSCTHILMSAGSEFSKKYSPLLSDAGCYVIDNSSAFRLDNRVPLLIPEVNLDDLNGQSSRIISNPNCSTIQMLVAIEGLRSAFGVDILNVATYQSVSGSGQQGIDELKAQTAASQTAPSLYPQTILNNLLPSIGPFEHGGPCEEEEKMIAETHKIYHSNRLLVLPTTVRVPVYHTHGEAITVKLSSTANFEQVEAALQNAKGVIYHSSTKLSELSTPATCAGSKKVHVSRLRLNQHCEHSSWVQLWVVADNLLKGAATNAVQILEGLGHKNS